MSVEPLSARSVSRPLAPAYAHRYGSPSPAGSEADAGGVGNSALAQPGHTASWLSRCRDGEWLSSGWMSHRLPVRRGGENAILATSQVRSSQMVESRSIPSGAASPGPTPPGLAKSRRWPSNLARWTARIESDESGWPPPEALRQEGASPWPDGALARHAQVAGLHPPGCAGTSASSSAVAPRPGCRRHSSVIILSLVFGTAPGHRPRSTATAGRVRAGSRCQRQGGRKEQFPAAYWLTKRRSSKVPHLDPVGAPVLRWQHRTADLLFRGRFFATKPIIP